MLTQTGYNKLIGELKDFKPIPFPDLFRIRDALAILDKYGLADKDLVIEVNKYILDQDKPLFL